ncbi:MAG: hypothetical protein V3R66_02390 [Rhodospirillales bacterium]
MTWYSKMLRIFAGALVVVATTFTFKAFADEPSEDPMHTHDAGDMWAIARGGRLYDNWMVEMLHDQPRENHPAYPEVGRKRGFPTWRCKECHGWDYKGAEGAYGKGSNHYTGIKGIRGVVGRDYREIVSILTDKTHGYAEKHLSHAAQEMLAMFLSKGQIDMDRYIDPATKKAHGDIKRGGQLYQTICVVCHGFDGKEINFKSDKYPQYAGTVCKRNPWESLHKIRFGQPGVGMMALANQDVKSLVDILAYCQTLPVE